MGRRSLLRRRRTGLSRPGRMELRTYTSLWGVEKRLYKFYDINLPYPVSVKQLGIFVGALVPWLILMNLVNMPFEPPWHLVWIAPPILAMIYANRPIAEGKTLVDYVMSQVKFFLSNHKYSGLRPEKSTTDKRSALTGTAWIRT